MGLTPIGRAGENMSTYVFDAILTPEEEGGYSVEFPTLPGCYTCGDSYIDAITMAADAARTWVASSLCDGARIPAYKKEEAPAGSERACICFDSDPSWVVEGPVVSAAQAARELGITPARITHMLATGQLEGFRNGRRTFVTQESVDARKAVPHPAGRPRCGAIA